MKKINWRYAIGELIIVTLGISIAFALNSWAESNKQEEKTKVYLDGIIADLQDDLTLLDSTITETERRIGVIQGMMPYLFGRVGGRDSLMLAFFGAIDPVLITPHQSTIQTMMRSGDLSLFQDVEFKNELIEHYDGYVALENEYDRHEAFSKEFVAGYFMENMDYASMRYNPDYSFINDKFFKNLVFSMRGIYSLSLERQKEAKARVSEVLPKVEDQLNELN